jgi:hypothetical protein
MKMGKNYDEDVSEMLKKMDEKVARKISTDQKERKDKEKFDSNQENADGGYNITNKDKEEYDRYLKSRIPLYQYAKKYHHLEEGFTQKEWMDLSPLERKKEMNKTEEEREVSEEREVDRVEEERILNLDDSLTSMNP